MQELQNTTETQTKNTKTFDRSICFTFFRDYWETASEIRKDLGDKQACDYLFSIIEYGLFQIEPDCGNVDNSIKYAFISARSNIDKSQEKRSRGFKKEDTEKTEAILQYKKTHPNASQREIAKATCSSLGKVNNVLKSVHDKKHEHDEQSVHDKHEQHEQQQKQENTTSLNSYSYTDSNTYSSPCSYSYTSREREREHLDDHEQLSRKEGEEERKRHNADAKEDAAAKNAPAGLSEEKKNNSTLWMLDQGTLLAILSDFEDRVPYTTIRKKYHLSYDDVNASMGETIKGFLSYHEELEHKELAEKAIEQNPSKANELLKLMNPIESSSTDNQITQQSDLSKLLTNASLSLDEWLFMMKYEDWLSYDGWFNDQEIQQMNHNKDYVDFLIETANLNTETWKEVYRKNNATS